MDNGIVLSSDNVDFALFICVLCLFFITFFEILECVITHWIVRREIRHNKEKYINGYLDRHPKLFEDINE